MVNNFSFEKFKCPFLLFLGSILFGFNNSIISWIVFVPVFLLVYYSSIKTVWLYGGLYGILSYLFYLPWLVRFSPVAMAGVSFLYFIFCAILFIALKLACVKNSYVRIFLFTFVICGYEYLKTLGFTGFSYGVNGYNQWKNIYLIQISDFAGVWGVSFILNYFSSVVFTVVTDFAEKRSMKKDFYFFAVGLLFVGISLVYGAVKVKAVEKRDAILPKIKIAAVQNNSDPWKGGIAAYEKDVQSLMELTDWLLDENPDVSLVVWPETAVVPSILKHYKSEADLRRHALMVRLLEYMNSKSCGFVVGNFNSSEEDDFNSAFLFIPGKNLIPPEPEIYSKIHLVPFTEYFPYEKQFPRLYKLLLDGDTHLWTPGKERKVFDYQGFKFSTPICFEDNFGADCRKFVKNGAEAFINLSNDAWSKSYRCQVQHLQMAVFRSVENHIPSVRSTASGQTCVISSTGKIMTVSRPFERNYVAAEISVLNPLFDNHSLIDIE